MIHSTQGAWASNYTHRGLYAIIRDRYWHCRWQAMHYLWQLWTKLEDNENRTNAYGHLKAIEDAIKADEQIERSRKGVSNG